MGCDISLFVEKREGGEWKRSRKKYPCGRDYLLFSVLADVRNDFGTLPIDDPKGLPSDVSFSILKESHRWGEDAHSHSYLSLQELMDYDWTQTVIDPYISKKLVLREELLEFLKFRDSLKRLKGVFSPEDVRIVFFFDN